MNARCVVVAASVVLLAGCSSDAQRATTTSTTSTTSTSTTTTTAPGCGAPTSGERTVDVAGTERRYLVRLPDPLPTTADPAPVVIEFHGSGSDMVQQAAYSLLPEQGTARGYVVVTPQGTGEPRGWSLAGPGSDDAFVDAILTQLASEVCIDIGHVFAVGISNGSAYSALMACRAPYRIAGVGMVAASLPSLCPVDHPIPAVAFHGTADPVVPYGGGNLAGQRRALEAPGAESSLAQWAQRNGCGEPADQRIGTDVLHRVWAGCPAGDEVELYSIEGGGHTWPGAIDVSKIGKGYLGATTQTVSATTVFLDVFDRLR